MSRPEVFLYPYSELDSRLVAACETFGAQLMLTFSIDQTKLLLALAGVESSFARDNKPRFEKAYAPGGRYHRNSPQLQDEHKKWGDDASCSWGPWQILHIVAVEHGYRGPPAGLADPKVSIHYVVKHLNKFSRNGANSLERLLDCYNTGNYYDKNFPYKYVGKWWKMYNNLIEDRIS